MIKRKLVGNNEFLKNILTVATGVFFSQTLIVVVSPILTRMFTPDTFGSITFFLSIVNVITVVSTARYENAILLPRENKLALNLVIFLIYLVLVFSLIVLIVINVLGLDNLSEMLNFSQKKWLNFLPLMLMVNSLFFVFRNYLNRNKEFKLISKGGIYKSIILNAILLLGGFFSPYPKIFLIANILSQAFETMFLFIYIFRTEGNIFKKFDLRLVKLGLSDYKNFPKFSLPADLVNVYTAQNPIILLSTLFNDAVIGQFSITQRVLGIPIKLVSGSTLEVYKQRAAEEYANHGNCIKSFLETFKFLALISILPTIVIFIFSPVVFTFVFGVEWYQAGYFARYLSIMFFFQFICSPLGFTLIIANKQYINLFWQVGLLLITSLGLYIGYVLKSSNLSVLLFSISYSIMYMVYLYLSYNAALSKK